MFAGDSVDFRFNFDAVESSEQGARPSGQDKDSGDVAPAQEEAPALEVRRAEVDAPSPKPGVTRRPFVACSQVPPGWHSEQLELCGCVLLKPSGATVAAASARAGLAASTSDLVPGRYEGGFKLWECSVDLCRYLCGGAGDAPRLQGAHVLELGCGHGLPGVLAALKGAASVTWQDYNGEVLHSLTAPTVAANLRAAAGRREAAPQLRFVSGDWGALHATGLLPARQYDVILTADTLYSPAAQVLGDVWRMVCLLIWRMVHDCTSRVPSCLPHAPAAAAGTYHALLASWRLRAGGGQVLLLRGGRLDRRLRRRGSGRGAARRHRVPAA